MTTQNTKKAPTLAEMMMAFNSNLTETTANEKLTANKLKFIITDVTPEGYGN